MQSSFIFIPPEDIWSSDFHKRSTAKGKRRNLKSKKTPVSPVQSIAQDSVSKPLNGQDEQSVKSPDREEDYEKELEMEKFRNHYRVVAKNRIESGDGKCSRGSGSGLWSSGEEFKLYDASEGEKPKPGFDIEDIVIEEVEGRLGELRKAAKPPGTDKTSIWSPVN